MQWVLNALDTVIGQQDAEIRRLRETIGIQETSLSRITAEKEELHKQIEFKDAQLHRGREVLIEVMNAEAEQKSLTEWEETDDDRPEKLSDSERLRAWNRVRHYANRAPALW